MLSQQECLDLRKKVLSGYQLTLEEAKQVFETLRQKQAEIIIEGENKPKRTSKKKSISDDELDQQLEGLGL